MSAYIVSDNTIHAIVKGFEIYNVEYVTEDNIVKPSQCYLTLTEHKNDIGQSLLHQNYKSVNYRYNEKTATPKYNYKNIEINEGALLGCINCYIYQACETSDFFESKLYESLQRLKGAMLEKMIKEKGQAIPWGYED